MTQCSCVPYCHVLVIGPAAAIPRPTDIKDSPSVSHGAKLYLRSLSRHAVLFPTIRALVVLILLTASIGCGSLSNESASDKKTVPVYNKETGRLEQLVSDSDGDGKVDTRAFMNGRRLERIEVDRNGDGTPDRFEYYAEAPPHRVVADSPAGRNEVERVEEANGPDARITRREFYEAGEMSRVEDDSDADGRVDRWEHYDAGVLSRIDVDLQKLGFPNRRFHYRRDGSIDRVEVDPDGAGNWRPAPDQ